jgi:hypothetical protein
MDEEEIGQAGEALERLVFVDADGFVAAVSAGGDDGAAEFGEQQVMEGCVGEHHAKVRVAGRDGFGGSVIKDRRGRTGLRGADAHGIHEPGAIPLTRLRHPLPLRGGEGWGEGARLMDGFMDRGFASAQEDNGRFGGLQESGFVGGDVAEGMGDLD